MEFVAPHDKVAREVTEKDFKTVHDQGLKMLDLCAQPYGLHVGAMALAHPQFEDKDPLRFFVTAVGDIIINPVITRHTKHESIKDEGCLSFPNKRENKVKRYYKMEVSFLTFDDKDLMKHGKLKLREQKGKFKGVEAQIWQHEIDHLDGVNVWEKYGEKYKLKKSHIKGLKTPLNEGGE